MRGISALLGATLLWPAADVVAQTTAVTGTSLGRDRAEEPAAVRDARGAQRSFEFTRRVRLPFEQAPAPRSPGGYYYGTGCPVRIGRLCWWDNNDDGAPPPEPASVVNARIRLLENLDRAATADPTSDWVAGQRVRYAVEAGRTPDALAAATACRGTPVWCVGLRGVALHLANRSADATAAFDSADALRTPAERCAWYDVSPWLEPGAARAYRRLACGSPERARWESRFWRLAQPLWMLPANDLRAEWNARRIVARVHSEGANPYGMPWGEDLAECALRYGWPTGWSVSEASGGSLPYGFTGGSDRGIVGHEAAPSYDFVPRGDALAITRTRVSDLADEAWTLRPSPTDPTPMRYAPAYARGGIGTPTHQLARFRRGDTAVVVAAYDATRDSLWSEGSTPPSLAAGLTVVDDSGGVAAADRRDSVARRGVLVARIPGATALARTEQSEAHFLLGLEILQRDTVHTADGRRVLGRALRDRRPLRPLGADVALSDLLLLRRSPGPTPTLEAALDSAAGSLTVRRGAAGGLYWEQYRTGQSTASRSDSAAVAPDTIVIGITRLTRTLRERLVGAIGRAAADRTIALRYPDPGGSTLGRALGLSWPDAPAGEYRLDVTLVPGTPGRQPVTSALVVHLVED